jgi:hypothetical protein
LGLKAGQTGAGLLTQNRLGFSLFYRMKHIGIMLSRQQNEGKIRAFPRHVKPFHANGRD